MEINDICVECGKPASHFIYSKEKGKLVCLHCLESSESSAPYFKEMGVENPVDAKGSTAHVRDIKSRRYDAKTDTTFRYKPPKTYFFGG